MPRLKRKSQEQLNREAKQRISELRDTESEEDALNRKEIEAFNVNATLFAFSKVIVMLP